MNKADFQQLSGRLKAVQERIRSIAMASGRDPDQIELVVVTKGMNAQVIKALVELGIDNIGESYLKEALFKQELLRDYPIKWHMIGTIQPGKSRQVVYNFSQVHSLDSIQLAEKLAEGADELNRTLPVYLELNVSGEETKHGWQTAESPGRESFLADLERILSLKSLDVKGLMTMAPYSEDPEDSRKHFQALREMRDRIRTSFPGGQISGLSMGMSGDYEVAIQEGASVVRIGTAIVGPRRG